MCECRSWWAGDVWRTSLLLRRRRPDLQMTVLDSSPTGLVLITNFDPGNTTLSNSYSRCVQDMLSWNLDEIGTAALFAEMDVCSTLGLQAHEDISKKFWL